MDKDMETLIRARAHALWEEEGCPEGSALRHWLEAEHEVLRRAEAAEEPAAISQSTDEEALNILLRLAKDPLANQA